VRVVCDDISLEFLKGATGAPPHPHPALPRVPLGPFTGLQLAAVGSSIRARRQPPCLRSTGA
jgi:hypothetical protein